MMLTQVFRQEDARKQLSSPCFRLNKDTHSDLGFVDMLNEMRYGKPSKETIQTFRLLDRPVVYDDGVEPTEL